ncbi:MAG: ABC transporter ATP-binding protein [Ignavibacteria bacterium]|nr:ABC transporter ATP-binding protein [Ignavibacteria bacterium]
MEVVLETKNLSKKFKKITAVDNLSLCVYRGDVFGFLGPNGAGKSTTIRMLTSLIYPDEGEIFIFNKKLSPSSKSVLKKVGAIVESPDFYLYLTAYKNLEILARLYGFTPTKNQIMEILDFVGLANRWNSKVKTFSHGMKQRLGIAQALLHNPELIILDEPTTGLDPQGMKEIRELVISLSKDKGKTIFISSHLLHEVELIANRMIIINKGQKVVEGYVKDLLDKDKAQYVFQVSNIDEAKNVLVSMNLIPGEDFRINQNEITISTKKVSATDLNKTFVQKGIDVFAFYPRRTLEEYFLEITHGQK